MPPKLQFRTSFSNSSRASFSFSVDVDCFFIWSSDKLVGLSLGAILVVRVLQINKTNRMVRERDREIVIHCNELVYAIKETDKSQELPSAVWGPTKTNDVDSIEV